MDIKTIKFIENIPRVKSRGFTLLEVLIASSIFAVIMVITTGTVAQSSSYRNKLKTLREVNEETRRIADQITRDVRAGTTLAQVTALDAVTSPSTPVLEKFKNGLVLLNCKASCTFINNALASGTIADGTPFPSSGTDSINANTLVISTKDNYKIYALANDNKSIYYSGSIASGTTLALADINSVKNTAANKITSTNAQTAINFGGYCPEDLVAPALVQQPYIQFYITSRTYDPINSVEYTMLPATQRATAQLRSTVTSRSYNN